MWVASPAATKQGQATTGRVVGGGGETAWPLTTLPITWHTAHGCGALGSRGGAQRSCPSLWVGRSRTCSPWHLSRQESFALGLFRSELKGSELLSVVERGQERLGWVTGSGCKGVLLYSCLVSRLPPERW